MNRGMTEEAGKVRGHNIEGGMPTYMKDDSRKAIDERNEEECYVPGLCGRRRIAE